MNTEALKDLEAEFLEEYPEVFEDERLVKQIKKFNPSKLEELSKEFFKKDNFSQPEIICDNFVKIVYKSVVISFYDKMKLRDAFKELGMYEKDMFSIALYDLLYGNKKEGYEGIVEILKEYNLAKWTLISLVPYYLNRDKDYFVKPTTAKSIISYLQLKNLEYKPTPSYEFYQGFKKALDEIKTKIDKSLKAKDNIYLTAFLRTAIKICEIE
ncbi:hypothetical protein CP965_03340 [Halarcobacter mediterraneus]|uniref:Uncharacterized protein n=1 Tax=Halarcobacter mediterraneus TaxID=2023153 RepID=A0A4Q1B5T2_9BACT|nr:hypothetical protein [Halarcobacter mediterraneus]RXK14497.1 hypothetical protein CP965_03340 [Halarcobacter mediterraneus]